MKAKQEKLDAIALRVADSGRGGFLTAFADAWLKADKENKELLAPAWMTLIERYGLEEMQA